MSSTAAPAQNRGCRSNVCGRPQIDNADVQLPRLEIPSGVSSGLRSGRVRSLENSLEANHADHSRSNSSTDRYPRRSWRNFRLVGIEQIDMARDGSIAWKRKDVSPFGDRRRYRRFVFMFRRPSPKGTAAQEPALSDGDHPGGRA